jgi:1,4-dihydroxy-2-naphthoate polyprenyltransferase
LVLKKNKITIWFLAFRLRTLPLALANAVMGSFLALDDGSFKWEIFVLTVVTITLLQIVSNLANDYGDAVSGADRPDRVGPVRVTATGMVTRNEMKRMVIFFIILSMIVGSCLVFLGLRDASWKQIILFFILGASAIAAAVMYTVGKKPYGYRGLGDIFVFIFFGLVGVIGTYYLQTNRLDIHVIVPAAIIGLMSTAVLNSNNLRDINEDSESGKRTLAVQHGLAFARKYHLLLIGSAWLLTFLFTLREFHSWWQLLYLISLPVFIRNCWKIYHYKESSELNIELRNLSLGTLLFALSFGIGLAL